MENCENCIIYDWLTFSCKMDPDSLLQLLGIQDLKWLQHLGSSLRYGERWSAGGISLHFTLPGDFDHNPGCCIEMSGQGCREFETYQSKWDFPGLLKYIILNQWNISRLDVAYDDFSGVIDISEMARAARCFEFRSRLQESAVHVTSCKQDKSFQGYSVTHGTRKSRTFIRCYDKRVERGRFDLEHWVRFEIQLRHECALGFAAAPGCIGDKFRSVVQNYLAYCVPGSDSNKSRWDVRDWWSDFTEDAAKISVYSKKQVDYNRSMLENYVYHQAFNAIRAARILDGSEEFLRKLTWDYEGKPLPPLPVKYQKLVDQEKHDRILRSILNE